MQHIETKAANFLVVRENGVDTGSANWVGGRASLTAAELHLTSNGVNKLVGNGKADRTIALTSIDEIDYQSAFGTDILTLHVGDNLYQVRCYGAKGFKAQIELAIERGKNRTSAEIDIDVVRGTQARPVPVVAPTPAMAGSAGVAPLAFNGPEDVGEEPAASGAIPKWLKVGGLIAAAFLLKTCLFASPEYRAEKILKESLATPSTFNAIESDVVWEGELREGQTAYVVKVIFDAENMMGANIRGCALVAHYQDGLEMKWRKQGAINIGCDNASALGGEAGLIEMVKSVNFDSLM